MAWTVRPRKPNGLDRFLEQRASVIDYARRQGWGDLVSVGESGDRVCFNFADGSQFFWLPPSDPTTDARPGGLHDNTQGTTLR
jgi:hypothetical protein